MTLYLWVMLGGALGTGGEFAFSGYAAHRWGETFPWGTLIINVSRSLVIGLFAALSRTRGPLDRPSHRPPVFSGLHMRGLYDPLRRLASRRSTWRAITNGCWPEPMLFRVICALPRRCLARPFGGDTHQ